MLTCTFSLVVERGRSREFRMLHEFIHQGQNADFAFIKRIKESRWRGFFTKISGKSCPSNEHQNERHVLKVSKWVFKGGYEYLEALGQQFGFSSSWFAKLDAMMMETAI